MPNDCEIRLAVAQLLNCSFWVLKSGILVQVGATPRTQPPRASEARLSLDSLDCIVNGITVGLNVLMVRAIKGRDEKMEVDASFWRGEQGGEDGTFICEVMV